MMQEPITSETDWLRTAVQAETALGCDLQIGGSAPTPTAIDPTQLQTQLDRVRLYSLLFGELKRLIDEVDFGSGAEAAFTQGRRLIYERLNALTPDQEAALNALMVDSTTRPLSQIQTQLRQHLYQLLNEAEWQTITTTAVAVMQSKLIDQVTSA